MSASISTVRMNVRSTWIHRRVYYLACGFMFAAAASRALLIIPRNDSFDPVLLLLAAWPAAFLGSLLLAGRSSRLSALLIGVEVAIILALLLISQRDFFALLFAIPCMQVRQQFTPRSTAILVGLSTALVFLSLVPPYGILYAFAFAALYFGGSILLVVYIGTARRASLIESQQQALVVEVQQANHKLELYAQQLEQLAAQRERQRLARELHDSVTQTLFSMTLTTQSALLLLDRDPHQVGLQLERLNQLTQSALREMQVLISKLAPKDLARCGLVSYIQQHLDERRRLEDLSIRLEVDGSQPLALEEQAGLFRVAQEALNNVVKHARVSEGVLRLHLREPFWMEIEDRGIGFDPEAVGRGGGVGLESMHERADEIGWTLRVHSSRGNGTRIRVEKEPGGGKQA